MVPPSIDIEGPKRIVEEGHGLQMVTDQVARAQMSGMLGVLGMNEEMIISDTADATEMSDARGVIITERYPANSDRLTG